MSGDSDKSKTHIAATGSAHAAPSLSKPSFQERGRIGVPIPEDSYKPDLSLLDRYQSYSGELLRISLLGLAGYGFLIKDVVMANHDTITRYEAGLRGAAWPLITGCIFLGLSAAFALAHRGLSSDAMSYLVLFLRATDDGYPNARSAEKAKCERKWLVRLLKLSGYSLILSPVFLALGAVMVIVTFAVILFFN